MYISCIDKYLYVCDKTRTIKKTNHIPASVPLHYFRFVRWQMLKRELHQLHYFIH